MSSTIIPTAGTTPQDLARTVLQKFDANGDGQFSVDEFSNFLGAFVKSLTGGQAPTTENGATTAVTTTALLSTVTPGSSRLGDPLPPCPPGWNAEKWANSAHTSVKYVAGRVLARYEPSDWVDETKREQILADLRAAGLNPTDSGKDKCDFNDGYGAIDIVQSASTGGKAWQWLPVKAG